MPLLNPPSITEALATSPIGVYEPPLPPIKETIPLNVVSEIMYHGRTQNINKIYLPLTRTWERARESLRWASEGWQMRRIVEMQRNEMEGEGKRDMGGDVVGMANRGGEESDGRKVAGGGGQADAGDSPWKGKYQVVDKKGVPGKEVFDLRDEREWRVLRRTVVKEGKDVVVWDARMFKEMQARKAWLAAAEEEELVDFHNICEMDRSSLTTGVDLETFAVEVEDVDAIAGEG